MKTRNQWRGIKFVVGMAALCGFAISAYSTVLIDEVFDSGYNRTARNIAGGNMAWFKSRTATSGIVNVGSLSMSSSGNTGADAYYGFFTDVGANIGSVGSASSVSNGHLLLGIGDTLITSVSFYYGTAPTDTSTAAIRFGMFDDAGTRSEKDFSGGLSTTAFTNNPGYGAWFSVQSTSTNGPLSIIKRTQLTTTGVFSSSSDYTALGASLGGVSTAQSSGELLTLKFSVTRYDASTWTISSGLYDSLSDTLLFGDNVTESAGLSSFNWLAWRVPRGPDAAGNGPYTFTDLKVEVLPVPEPSTLMLAGTGLVMALLSIRRRRS